jgi:hypothetical protein
MKIVFFDVRGIVHNEFVPQGQTVNQEFYVRHTCDVLPRLCPDLWVSGRSGQRTSLHDNARPQIAQSVDRFVAKRNVTVLQHPLYSSDLSVRFFSLSTA